MNLKTAINRAVGLRYALAWIFGLLSLLSVGPSVAQQRPAFETTVARVRIDVIVTDGNGTFVEGLGGGDFVVFEDGEPQEVLSVELVGGSAGARTRVPATSRGAVGAPVPVAGESPVPAGDGEGRALVFLVDLPGMDWRNKTRFASAWEKLLADSDDLGVRRAVYMIDQVGRLRELAPLTFDAGRLREAAATVSAEPLVRKSVQDQLAAAPRDDDPDDLYARSVSAEERARARATIELLTQFCKALATHGGRTALVWITSEVQITLAGPLELRKLRFTADVPMNAMAPDRLVSRQLEELYRAANSANVSIYTLDPTPADELHGIGFDVQNRTADRALNLEGPVQSALNGLRDALRSTAAETGGKAFINWMDPAEALRDIETDTSRFYLLTYANPPPIGDGRYHEIRVEVKERNLNVRARSGYTDYPIDELDDRLLSGALSLPGTVGGAPLVAWALRKWSPTGDPVLAIALRTPSDDLSAQAPEFELHGLAVGRDGELESTLGQRIREASGVTPYPVYLYEWGLPPGAYDLHLVVRNPVKRELMATAISVEVPAPTSEWATSDVVLTVADGAGRQVPVIGDALIEDEELTAYVEVVFGQDPVVSGDLFDVEGSEKIAQLPPGALQRGDDGIFRGTLRLTGIPAGDYALQVTVTDAEAGKHRVFRLPLRVRPRYRPTISELVTGPSLSQQKHVGQNSILNSLLQASCLDRLIEQAALVSVAGPELETGAHEVLVVGERPPDAAAAHQRERDAVGEADLLIGELAKQLGWQHDRRSSHVRVPGCLRQAPMHTPYIDLVNSLVYARSMSTMVGVHEAKTHLSRLLRRVSAGEEIVIARAGEPIARLVPVGPRRQRVLGMDRGRYEVPEDFDAPLPPEILDAFEA